MWSSEAATKTSLATPQWDIQLLRRCGDATLCVPTATDLWKPAADQHNIEHASVKETQRGGLSSRSNNMTDSRRGRDVCTLATPNAAEECEEKSNNDIFQVPIDHDQYQKNLFAWLKLNRMHKYYPSLAQLGPQEVFALTADTLQTMKFTKGAVNKYQSMIRTLQEEPNSFNKASSLLQAGGPGTQSKNRVYLRRLGVSADHSATGHLHRYRDGRNLMDQIPNGSTPSPFCIQTQRVPQTSVETSLPVYPHGIDLIQCSMPLSTAVPTAPILSHRDIIPYPNMKPPQFVSLPLISAVANSRTVPTNFVPFGQVYPSDLCLYSDPSVPVPFTFFPNFEVPNLQYSSPGMSQWSFLQPQPTVFPCGDINAGGMVISSGCPMISKLDPVPYPTTAICPSLCYPIRLVQIPAMELFNNAGQSRGSLPSDSLIPHQLLATIDTLTG